jgi:ABC-type sugar transport system substrate-binding protein
MRRLRPGVVAAVFAAVLAAAVLAACSSSSSPGPSSKQVTVGVALTYNDTAFWAAYLNYETQYASQLHVKVLGPLLAGTDASLQNTQIENLVNEGAQAIIVNPETATSLGPAIAYATAHHVQLISVDTIIGVGHVYMVVRASNVLYGDDACAYIGGQVRSGYVLDLEGDLTSSNGIDRTNAFDTCMAADDPGVHVLKDPTVWTESTAVSDAETAVAAYGSSLKAIYSQWSSPDIGVIPLLAQKHLTGKVLLVSDDGVPFEMCDISKGTLSASQSQPANLYAYWALKYSIDAADGVVLQAGAPGGGAPTLQMLSFAGDSNLGDPIVAPFVTKTSLSLVMPPVGTWSGTVSTTAVTDSSLWGNVYGSAHGGVCSSANAG